MDKEQIQAYRQQAHDHLVNELLPFWLDRCKDTANGGFITHFDKDGNDTGQDQKSLIAQARTVYTMSSAHRADYGGGKCADFAAHGVEFLIDKMWDKEHGGFFWTVDRKGNIEIDKKILYGLSFAIYALSEYTLAAGDKRGIEYAEKTFDLMQIYAADTMYGGYFEMFERNWDRFEEDGQKPNAEDNTSAGHNVEFAWLLMRAADIMGVSIVDYEQIIKKQLDHAVKNGIDYEYGGVYVEGPHAGGVSDMEKEFWRQAEVMIGMLEATLRFGNEKYFRAYETVHRFVFEKGINHRLGEWWPLTNRDGTKQIWTHMSHSWKVNYHTVRCMIQCIKRLDKLAQKAT